MFKLDNALLEELGLGALQPGDKQMMLDHIYEQLELRVGMRLAEQMTDQQLDEFEKLMPAEGDSAETKENKDKAAFSWLETNFPNYKDVVSEELDKLKAEIRAQAPAIMASTMGGGTQADDQDFSPSA